MKHVFTHAGLLVFFIIYPFFSFLSHHQYPLFRLELFVMVGLSIFLVLLVFSCFKKHPRFYLVFYYPVFLFWITISPHRIVPLSIFIYSGVLLLGCFFALLIFNKLHKILFFFAVGLLLSSLILNLTNKENIQLKNELQATLGDNDLVVYIILDEHLGVDGFPKALSSSFKRSESVSNFFTQRQFTVFTKAYSPYFYTENAIPAILNISYPTMDGFYLASEKRDIDDRSLKENYLFKYFSKKDYQISVYQPNYLDFCTDKNVDFCFRYKRNSPTTILSQNYSLPQNLSVLGSLYLYTNTIFYEFNKRFLYADFFPIRTGPLEAMPSLFSHLSADVEIYKTGKHLIFAHILAPHSPYVYNQDCTALVPSAWLDRSEFNNEGHLNSEKGYEERYNNYYHQMECTHKQLGLFLENLRAAGLYDKATIVVHGDHGSRINRAYNPYYDYNSHLTPEDLTSSFSALLAIKKPHQMQGGVDVRQNDLISILKTQLYDEVSSDKPSPVYLKQKKGKQELIAVPMVSF
ncbi:sulfatase-like hydrolase/transferase [bacterium]|nr:sulfatase-like hydrolase/transferase [bacterium]